MRICHIVILSMTLSLFSLVGCGPEPGSGLTGQESAAVQAAVNAPMGLTQAISATQTAAVEVSPAAQTVDGETTFGTCPEVTTDLSLAEGLAADLTIDFGEGCSPFGTDDYTCSGSAGGTFRYGEQSIDATFDALSCGGQTLSGTTSVVYSISMTRIGLAGAWDLEYTYQDETYGLEGAGSGEHYHSPVKTVVSTFSGSLSSSEGQWDVQISELTIEYAAGGLWLPSSGEVTLSGSDIRTIVVKFSEETPSTGEVQVSIDGSPFITVDITAT